MSSAAQILREKYLATKVLFTPWWTQSKSVAKTIKQRMDAAVNAQPKAMRPAPKLIYNQELPPLAEISSFKQQVKDYWEANTLSYRDDGVRLLRKVDLDSFHAYMTNAKQKLLSLAGNIDDWRDRIIEDARERLGDAFSLSDYPLVLAERFGIEVSHPALTPPSTLPPEIYQQQCQLLQSKIEEAASGAQQHFTQQFAELVANLTERLTPEADGKKKIFRDSVVTNLKEFFEQFDKLKLSSGDDLDQLIGKAKELLSPVDKAQELRDSAALRTEIATGLGSIEQQLAKYITKAPRRAIIKPPAPKKESLNGTPQLAAV